MSKTREDEGLFVIGENVLEDRTDRIPGKSPPREVLGDSLLLFSLLDLFPGGTVSLQQFQCLIKRQLMFSIRCGMFVERLFDNRGRNSPGTQVSLKQPSAGGRAQL